jgi:probable F420-dependent oxidoreductase
VQVGVVFPQTEIGDDPGAVRALAAAAHDLGYRHLLAYDHVVGADPAVHQGWSGPYDIGDTFYEPMVLFAHLAALWPLEFVTGILIAPQRQTVLVAKQAATLDRLAGGKLRLGVGLGWNRVEYQAMGMSFEERGRRLEEQLVLLRRLWSEDSVTFRGELDTVIGAGIAPPPLQRPIPLWVGAVAPPALRRVGRLADGWLPQVPPGPRMNEALGVITAAAREAGRDPTGLGIEGRLEWSVAVRDHQLFERHVDKWRSSPATHLSVSTMHAGLVGADQHIAALQEAAGVLETGG